MAVEDVGVRLITQSEAQFMAAMERSQKAVKGIGDAADKTQSPLHGMTTKAMALSVALGQALYNAAISASRAIFGLAQDSVKAASDLNETVSKVGIVFDKSAAKVLWFGKSSATALGMSENAALAAAGTYGNLFRSMGMAEDQSADMSIALVQLASDLASFNNIDPTEALEKLRAGLVGESEPLKSLGINLNETILSAEALRLGLIKDVKKPLNAVTKAQAAYSLIMKQSSLAQGDFARTSKGLANQQRIFAANLQNIKATLGTALLPIVNKVMIALNKMFGSPIFQEMLNFVINGLGTLFDWLSEKIPAAIEWLKTVWETVFLPPIQAAWNWIKTNVFPIAESIYNWLYTNIPLAINWLKDKWETVFSPSIQAAWNWVKDNVAAVFGPVKTWLETNVPAAISTLKNKWETDFSPAIQTAWNWVKDNTEPIFKPVQNWIETLIPKAIELGEKAWEEYKKALVTIRDYLGTNFIPKLEDLRTEMEINLPPVIDNLKQKFYYQLYPALIEVRNYLDTYVIPIFATLKDIVLLLLEKALTPVKDFLFGAFYEGWKKISDFLKIDVSGAFSGLHWGILQPLVDFFNGPMKEALGTIYQKLQDLKNLIENFKMPNLSLPGAGGTGSGSSSTTGSTMSSAQLAASLAAGTGVGTAPTQGGAQEFFQNGGWYKIPPGFENHTWPVGPNQWAESGEHVLILPKTMSAGPITNNYSTANNYNLNVMTSQSPAVVQRSFAMMKLLSEG